MSDEDVTVGGDTSAIDAAARRLARPALAPLVAELAERFGDGTPVAVSLRRLDQPARSAIADLLGSARIPAASGRLPVARLLAVLALPGADALRAAVEVVHGPIADRRAHRSAAAAERVSLWRWFDAAVATVLEAPRPPGRAAIPDLAGWAARVRSAGVRGGVERHRRRLEGALAVLQRLPADGVTLAALAADTLGDPHGLDRGRSVAALVLDALEPCPGGARDAESVRGVWERAGVAPDALSSTVLVLGLRTADDHPLAGYLRLAASASEPVVLTLAQLRRWPLAPLRSDRRGFVFENPSVVAEAARRGWAGPPLLCSSGRPTVAAVTLLRQLAADGAPIYQHADFDAAGLGITAWLADRAGTTPWKMRADDYQAAVESAPERLPLSGVIPPTPWDPALSVAMTEVGAALYEEQLRDELLDVIGLRPL